MWVGSDVVCVEVGDEVVSGAEEEVGSGWVTHYYLLSASVGRGCQTAAAPVLEAAGTS